MMLGAFRDNDRTRQEFLQLIAKSHWARRIGLNVPPSITRRAVPESPESLLSPHLKTAQGIRISALRRSADGRNARRRHARADARPGPAHPAAHTGNRPGWDA